LRQGVLAVRALLWQHHFDLIHLSHWNQGAMVPRMPGLAARFAFLFVLALALVLPSTQSLFPCQTVRGRRLGGVGGVSLPQCQLTLQVHDLLFGIRELLIAFGYFASEVLNLSPQPIIFAL
jgi:hypothetical protein